MIKNEEGTLPLTRKNKIAVVGLAADGEGAIYGGQGSGRVTPKQPISILNALISEGMVDSSVVEAHIPYTNGTNL